MEGRLQRDYEARLNPDDRLYSKDELIERAKGAQAILPCHTEHLAPTSSSDCPPRSKSSPTSRSASTMWTSKPQKEGIVVTNTPDVLSDATAELTMMLMIGAARRAGEGEKLVREGRWKDWSPAFMVGTQVTGKRLGILGMGRVGQVVAKRARGFDMTDPLSRRPTAAGRAGSGRHLPRDGGRACFPTATSSAFTATSRQPRAA